MEKTPLDIGEVSLEQSSLHRSSLNMADMEEGGTTHQDAGGKRKHGRKKWRKSSKEADVDPERSPMKKKNRKKRLREEVMLSEEEIAARKKEKSRKKFKRQEEKVRSASALCDSRLIALP